MHLPYTQTKAEMYYSTDRYVRISLYTWNKRHWASFAFEILLFSRTHNLRSNESFLYTEHTTKQTDAFQTSQSWSTSLPKCFSLFWLAKGSRIDQYKLSQLVDFSLFQLTFLLRQRRVTQKSQLIGRYAYLNIEWEADGARPFQPPQSSLISDKSIWTSEHMFDFIL